MAERLSEADTAADRDTAKETFRALGAQVRALRRAQGWTLKQFGDRCDLSHAFLSQVERGQTTASVVTIQRMASALGTTVSALLATPREESAIQVFRSGAGSTLRYADQVEDADVRALSHSGLPINALEYVGGPRVFGHHFHHPGYELIYVLKGAIELEVDGQCTRLSAGDSASYPGMSPHRWRAIGRVAPRILMVVGNSADRPTQLDRPDG